MTPYQEVRAAALEAWKREPALPRPVRTALYRRTDTATGRVYYGISDDPPTRWRQHEYEGSPLGKLLRSGADTDDKIVRWFPTRQDALEAEARAIRTDPAAVLNRTHRRSRSGKKTLGREKHIP